MPIIIEFLGYTGHFATAKFELINFLINRECSGNLLILC